MLQFLLFTAVGVQWLIYTAVRCAIWLSSESLEWLAFSLMYSESAALTRLQIEKWKMRIILSRLLEISFQIFKVNCFILYFTSVDRTKLSCTILAEEILRTAGRGDSGYI